MTDEEWIKRASTWSLAEAFRDGLSDKDLDTNSAIIDWVQDAQLAFGRWDSFEHDLDEFVDLYCPKEPDDE